MIAIGLARYRDATYHLEMTTTTNTNTGSRRVPQSGTVAMESMELDLEPLRAFGLAADVPDGPLVRMETGGFIVPGNALALTSRPGKKGRHSHAKERAAGLQQARPGSGSGYRAPGRLQTRGPTGKALGSAEQTRPSSSGTLPATGADPTAIEARSSPQTLGRRLSGLLKLEELEQCYPSSSIVRCSSGFALMGIDVGVIRSLPYRGRLLLEIPLGNPPAPAALPGSPDFVPMVRIWAWWKHGIRPTGHHMYPDASICTYMKGEWIWGRDPLHVLVDWSACWLAKTLHLAFFNRWPGPQHCSPWVAIRRKMLDEYCRCGEAKRYEECHYPEDRQRTPYELFWQEWAGAAGYLREVRRRGWPTTPPWAR